MWKHFCSVVGFAVLFCFFSAPAWAGTEVCEIAYISDYNSPGTSGGITVVTQSCTQGPLQECTSQNTWLLQDSHPHFSEIYEGLVGAVQGCKALSWPGLQCTVKPKVALSTYGTPTECPQNMHGVGAVGFNP